LSALPTAQQTEDVAHTTVKRCAPVRTSPEGYCSTVQGAAAVPATAPAVAMPPGGAPGEVGVCFDGAVLATRISAPIPATISMRINSRTVGSRRPDGGPSAGARTVPGTAGGAGPGGVGDAAGDTGAEDQNVCDGAEASLVDSCEAARGTTNGLGVAVPPGRPGGAGLLVRSRGGGVYASRCARVPESSARSESGVRGWSVAGGSAVGGGVAGGIPVAGGCCVASGSAENGAAGARPSVGVDRVASSEAGSGGPGSAKSVEWPARSWDVPSAAAAAASV